MKTKLLFLLVAFSVLISCEDSEPDATSRDLPKTETVAEMEDHKYELPVIFHVLYKNKDDNKQYIKEGRLAEVLANVNKLFKASANSVEMNLEFTLATESPTGQKLDEPGVERIAWETASIDDDVFMSDNSGKYAKLLWDPNDYINIMIYNFASDGGSTITLGVAHLPYITRSNFLDGLNTINQAQIALSQLSFPYCVSINSLYLHEENSPGRYNPLNINVTLAHELGHYLGLHHAFSEGEKGNIDLCKDTDYCEDTPTYNRTEYQAWLDQNISSSNTLAALSIRNDCSKGSFTSRNIMDYTYNFADQFTADQRKRIRHVLAYSPLMPKPKQEKSSTRTVPPGKLELPIRYLKCY